MRKSKYFRITFCCSEEEQKKIVETARSCGLPTSGYCKRVILGYRPKERLKPEEVELLQDVRKVKADLQRMANFFRASNYQMVVEELLKIINKLKVVLYDCNR